MSTQQAEEPESADDLSDIARQYFAMGRYELTDVFTQKALRADPENKSALCYRGAALYQLHRNMEAEFVLRKAVQHSPSDEQAQLYLGLCLLKLYPGNPEAWHDAHACFSKVLRRNPRNVSALAALGEMHLHAKDYVSATVRFSHATAVERNNGKFHRDYGYALFMLEQYNVAEKPLERAVQLMPQDIPARILLVQLYEKTAQYQKALDLGLEVLPDIHAEDNATHTKIVDTINRLRVREDVRLWSCAYSQSHAPLEDLLADMRPQ